MNWVKRMLRRDRQLGEYIRLSRYEYLQACYNHMITYDARQSDLDSFLQFSGKTAYLFSDDMVVRIVNRRLDRAGMP